MNHWLKDRKLQISQKGEFKFTCGCTVIELTLLKVAIQ